MVREHVSINIIIGSISSILFCLCAIPQIFKLLKTKDSRGLSVVSCCLAVVAYILGIIYIIRHLNRDAVMLWLYVYGLITTVLILWLTIRYKVISKISNVTKI